MRDVSRSEAKKEKAITIVTRVASVHAESDKNRRTVRHFRVDPVGA
ncbi:Hypothetical protein Y17_0734 [Pectobacterium wasabiae CFBP 3304]|nr:Hypothetical protein Y17_0734 [Pectobacterium wasabiae CFBP 3304]